MDRMSLGYVKDSSKVYKRKTNFKMDSKGELPRSDGNGSPASLPNPLISPNSQESLPSPPPPPKTGGKQERHRCPGRLHPKCSFKPVWLLAVVTCVISIAMLGVLNNCLTIGNQNKTAISSITRSADEVRPFLMRYVFNFTTPDSFTVAGHRNVLYCRDAIAKGTLCSNSNPLARTVFVGASNRNVTTNRLSSELYSKLQDFLSWTSGKSGVDEGWDRLDGYVRHEPRGGGTDDEDEEPSLRPAQKLRAALRR